MEYLSTIFEILIQMTTIYFSLLLHHRMNQMNSYQTIYNPLLISCRMMLRESLILILRSCAMIYEMIFYFSNLADSHHQVMKMKILNLFVCLLIIFRVMIVLENESFCERRNDDADGIFFFTNHHIFFFTIRHIFLSICSVTYYYYYTLDDYDSDGDSRVQWMKMMRKVFYCLVIICC